MAFYIAATARIVDVDTEEVINTGATIYSATNSAISSYKKTLTIGGTLNYNTGSTYYQYWKADIDSGYEFDRFIVTTSASSGNEPPASKTFTANPTGQWSFRQTSSQHTSSSNPQPYTVTLYLKRLKHTLTFDDNGGSGGPGVVEIPYGDSYTIPPTPPTKPQNTFEHWLSGGVEYALGESVTPDTDMTFVAIWSETPVPPAPTDRSDKIVYHTNGISYNSETGSIVYAR